eukprot:Skav202388  [mRNA]  locus=scaffold1406:397154:399005:- [translate_table: standard]
MAVAGHGLQEELKASTFLSSLRPALAQKAPPWEVPGRWRAEKRRVLTAFKLLQGPSGSARLGDWLQRREGATVGRQGTGRGLAADHGHMVTACDGQLYVTLLAFQPKLIWPKAAATNAAGTMRILTPFRIDVAWPKDVSTSPCMPPLAYVIFAGLVASLFVVMQVLDMVNFLPRIGGFYFVYLTAWSLLLQTTTLVLLFISTLWGYTLLEKRQNADADIAAANANVPFLVRFTLALWYICQPISMVVMILYWTTVNRFWSPLPATYYDYWSHLANYDKCPLYDVIDWNKPGPTFVVLAAALVGLLVVFCIYTGFFRCRDACVRSRWGEGNKANNV